MLKLALQPGWRQGYAREDDRIWVATTASTVRCWPASTSLQPQPTSSPLQPSRDAQGGAHADVPLTPSAADDVTHRLQSCSVLAGSASMARTRISLDILAPPVRPLESKPTHSPALEAAPSSLHHTRFPASLSSPSHASLTIHRLLLPAGALSCICRQAALYKRPLFVIPGTPALVQHAILNDRRHALTKVRGAAAPQPSPNASS